MFKVNNRNTRTRYEIFSKLATNTPERRKWLGDTRRKQGGASSKDMGVF